MLKRTGAQPYVLKGNILLIQEGWRKTKGSRNTNFPEFTPRFVSGWVGLREHNRGRRKADVEDCASEDRLKVA